jgi:uncharacterized damage-inducible protein DinB
MEQFYADIYNRFSELHKEVKQAVEGLDSEALDWIPAGNTNSINVLVTHLTESEKYWAADIASGQTSERVRAEEFEAVELNLAQLTAMLDEALDTLKEAFDRLSLDDLHTVRHAVKQDMHITTGWAILYALEHTAQHVGHIQLTVQLWEE